MKSVQRLRSALFFGIPIIPCLIAVGCLGQTPRKSVVLNSPVDRASAVSFFYIGDIWSHWRDPMNFYVADAGDPRLHTVVAEWGPSSKGVETWITASEMRTLIDKLAQSDLEWLDSKTVEHFTARQNRRDGMHSFDITAVSSKGTAKASIRLTRMCDELLQFDSVMPTPRLRWQFQTLRRDDGCVIPGYDDEAMPKD